ncbi:MAG TPA: alkaline phosphatase family protein, partial [Vicinamibacterales bacterium]
MRFLRMLSNAVVAALVAASYVVLLILHLNPALRLDDPEALPLVAVVLAAYAAHLVLFFYAAMTVRQLLATEPMSPGWLSYGVLSWLCAASAATAAVLMWLNLRGLSIALDPVARRRLVASAIVISVCAAVSLALAIVRASGRRSRVGALTFGLAVVASVAVPLAIRGRGLEPPAAAPVRPRAVPVDDDDGGRVLLLALDGASLDLVSPWAADGRLPNFAHLLDGGASMYLATLRPTQPAPAWAAVATGQAPARNGVRSAARYVARAGGASIDLLPDYCFAHALVSFGALRDHAHTSATLRTPPVWSILGRSGIRSTIVRWPLTWPATPIEGALVSEAFHQAGDVALANGDDLAWPPGLARALREETVIERASAGSGLPANLPEDVLSAWRRDRQYIDAWRRLEESDPGRFSVLRLTGIDAVGHVYMRYAVPRDFGDVSDEERRRHGRVLEQYYRFVDAEIGQLLDRLEPGDLLLVVSPFGLQPLSLPKRLLEGALGNTELSGTHERAPDGFLLAYGTPVQPGRRPRGSIADIAPTLLYFFGLPVARDMDGYARTDLFTSAFTAERPIAYIPSYQHGSGTADPPDLESPEMWPGPENEDLDAVEPEWP